MLMQLVLTRVRYPHKIPFAQIGRTALSTLYVFADTDIILLPFVRNYYVQKVNVNAVCVNNPVVNFTCVIKTGVKV